MNLINKKVEEYNLQDKVSINGNTIKWDEKCFEFKLPKSLNEFHRRVLSDIFPFSPYAIKREEMWATVISGLLDQSPQINIDNRLIDNLIKSKEISYKGNHEEAKENLKAIFEDLYYIESKSAKKVPYILPFHLQIIGNLKPKEPRGFNKLFKLLLSDEEGNFNKDLFNNVLELFNDESTLTPVDQLFIKTLSEQPKYNNINLNIKEKENLIIKGFDFYKQQGKLFQRDIKRILEMKISRIEKVRYFTIVLGLHFSIYVIRISYYLDWEFKTFTNVLENKDSNFLLSENYDEAFKSKLTFTFDEIRTPKSSKSVVNFNEMSQVVYRSYIHMVLLNTIRNICNDENVTFYEFTEMLKKDDHFNKWVNLCFEILMITYTKLVIKLNSENEITEFLSTIPEGNQFKRYELLITRHFANQKSSNRTPKTAGINFIKQSMAGASNYSFISGKPGLGDYYGMGKDLLILLVHLTIGVEEKKIRYKDFLSRISQYGFKPDQYVENTLIKKLEETGLLQKFSDSGEAIYVRTIF
jgi:DNA phosphorothioation-dependent restriction protein DptG